MRLASYKGIRLHDLPRPKIKRIKPPAPEIEKDIISLIIILSLRIVIIISGQLLRLIARIIVIKIKLPLR